MDGGVAERRHSHHGEHVARPEESPTQPVSLSSPPQPVTGPSTGHPWLTEPGQSSPLFPLLHPPTGRRHLSANRCLVSRRPRDSSDLTQACPSSPNLISSERPRISRRTTPACCQPPPCPPSGRRRRARRFTAASHSSALWAASKRTQVSTLASRSSLVRPSHCSGKPRTTRQVDTCLLCLLPQPPCALFHFSAARSPERPREASPRPRASLLSYQTAGEGGRGPPLHSNLLCTMECIR